MFAKATGSAPAVGDDDYDRELLETTGGCHDEVEAQVAAATAAMAALAAASFVSFLRATPTDFPPHCKVRQSR